jgi:hypothetical protein
MITRRKFYESVQFSVNGWKHSLFTIFVSAVMFVFFILLTFPGYSYEMLLSGVGYWWYMFSSLLWLTRESSGILGIVILIVYAIATGVLTTVVIGNIKYQSQGSEGLLSVIPAILFSGCASCGAGILGLLGVFGYTTILPFEGNLVRLLGVGVVLVVLGWIGDPQKCDI